MGLGSWWRGSAAAARRQQGDTAPLSEQAVLAAVADRLTELSGDTWTFEGDRVTGPGGTAVAVGAPHGEGPAHLDLILLPDAGRPQRSAVRDCVSGIEAGAEPALRRAVEVWAATTGVTLLELLAHNGRFAGHLHPDDADALPGWHAVHGGIVGWGAGDRQGAVQDWMLARPVLPRLAAALADGFDRDRLVGISLLFGGGAGRETAEVRVDGELHEQASKELLALDWPRVAEGTAYARTFVLLVRPKGR
ncbi:hypothetical protein BX265_0958 [Streptomyces sp. TLI_235]|nr:DUF6348 family protein [Streptomyces sp. TLI_235]PBC76252.1 hypothetical protein BX265_0958 [Streptomyces sp. TLI_235]